MSYVDENLLPSEHVTYRAHLHWAVYIPAGIVLALGLMFAISGGSTAKSGGGVAHGIGVFLVLVGAIMALGAWIRLRTSEFAVTDKRVVIKTGLIRRRSLELLLRQVETIGVDQGILGRIFGYGAISIGGTGGTKEVFKSISHPLEFRKQVQIQSTTSGPAAIQAAPTPGLEKTCPRCAESVKAAAKMCRFCNYEFT